MRTITRASTFFMDSYQRCISGIVNDIARQKYISYGDVLQEMTGNYIEKARRGELYTIPNQGRISDDYLVTGQLTKGEMTKLYSYYMVNKETGRYVYELILTSAKNICPYCGGIGFATTLDHYLPKSVFPQFSVSPENLIPACKDCNVEKKDTPILSYDEQPFHPFYDEGYDRVKWVSAEINSISPLTLSFFADPPEIWSAALKNRAINHFKKFNLAIRYSVIASDEIESIKSLRRGFMRNLPSEVFREHLVEVSNSLSFINGYKAVLYRCLSSSDVIINELDWLD